jgi:uridine kinase
MKQLFCNRLYLLGLVAKLCLIGFVASSFVRDLFVPFLDTAILSPFTNPWSLSPPHYFPYGSMLYLILALPRWLGHLIFGSTALGAGFLGLSLIKGPLLLLDFLLLWVLLQFAPTQRRRLLLFYWLNPVLFYITYIHGQLDVAAMALCLLSIHLLIRKRTLSSAIVMAAATLCKFHVVALVPFILVYIWNSDFAAKSKRNLIMWGVPWFALSVVGFVPLMSAGRFLYASAASPEAMRLFAAQIAYGAGHNLYLGVLVVLGVIARLCLSTQITANGLVFGCGLIFGAFLLGVDPMPGWYFWVMPFLALFFATRVNVPRSIFVALNFLYLIYFILVFGNEGKLGSPLSSIVFTLNQAALLACLLALWQLALRHESPLKFRGRPLMLGVSGDSGAGKSHFTQVLFDFFSPSNCLMVEGDDYHRWERGHSKWNEVTHLNPQANDLLSMSEHIERLYRGQTIYKSHYDHSNGRFSEVRKLEPRKVMVVQGLHTLYPRSMRRRFDLMVFMCPHPFVRLAWKIKRDVQERGHSLEKVLESFRRREIDSKLHIEPQRNSADWVIEVVPAEEVTEKMIIDGCIPQTSVRHIFWNDAPVLHLVEELNSVGGCLAKLVVLQDSIDRVSLEIAGDPSQEQVKMIATKLLPNLRHITRGRTSPVWRAGADGVTQLIAGLMLQQPGLSGNGVGDVLD